MLKKGTIDMKHKKDKQEHSENNEEMSFTDTTNNPFVQENNGEQEKQTEEKSDKTSNKMQEDYENLHNQYVRLAADFDNYRKRQAQERDNCLKYGTEEALRKMIEVLDNFDRAQKSIDTTDEAEKLKEFFNILYKQVFETLQKIGLKEIDTKDADFDPNFHEAVMQTPTSEHAENKIINELQKGYQYSDKVLRPALVNVAVSE